METFPCHFHYKVGDEIYYDGENFTGRICPGLLPSLVAIVHPLFLLGNRYPQNVMYRYRVHDALAPEMKKYDGMGFKPAKPAPASELPPPENWFAVCGDTRTLARFMCEPVDLSDCDYAQPFYRREMAILNHIKKEEGIAVSEIINTFTDFQRDEISPPLSPGIMGVFLNALEDMKYIEIRDGKAYSTGKKPPSQVDPGY